MLNRDRALQALQEEVDELRRRIRLLEQGGQLAAAPPVTPAEPAVAMAPVEPTAAVAESGIGDYVAARRGNRFKSYHYRSCYHTRRFLRVAGDFRSYPTREAAVAAGYKPCRRCAETAPVPVGYIASNKTRGAKTYHLRSCRYAPRIMASGTDFLEFADRAAAEEAGYRICERCII